MKNTQNDNLIGEGCCVLLLFLFIGYVGIVGRALLDNPGLRPSIGLIIYLADSWVVTSLLMIFGYSLGVLSFAISMALITINRSIPFTLFYGLLGLGLFILFAIILPFWVEDYLTDVLKFSDELQYPPTSAKLITLSGLILAFSNFLISKGIPKTLAWILSTIWSILAIFADIGGAITLIRMLRRWTKTKSRKTRTGSSAS